VKVVEVPVPPATVAIISDTTPSLSHSARVPVDRGSTPERLFHNTSVLPSPLKSAMSGE
jgi:hypothetical protein